MEAMGAIFLLAFFITSIAIPLGLIRPSLVVHWGKKRTRGRVLLHYGLATIVLLLLAIITLGMHSEQEAQEAQEAQEHLERGTELILVARKAYDSQHYSTAINSANEATQILNRAKNLPEAALLADQAQALLDSAKKAKAQTEARGHLEKGTRLLSVARRAYDSQHYLTAADSASEATQILNHVKKNLPEAALLADQAQALLNSAKETLSEELAIQDTKPAGSGFFYSNVSVSQGLSVAKLIGEMTNNSGRDHRGVKFLISVYDKNGKLIDKEDLFIHNFAKGDKKSFRVLFSSISPSTNLNQIASYKIQFDDSH